MFDAMLDRMDTCKDNCLRVCRKYDVGLAVKKGKRGVPLVDWHVDSEKECSLVRVLVVIGMMMGAAFLLYEAWVMMIRLRAKCAARRTLRDKYRKKINKIKRKLA